MKNFKKLNEIVEENGWQTGLNLTPTKVRDCTDKTDSANCHTKETVIPNSRRSNVKNDDNQYNDSDNDNKNNNFKNTNNDNDNNDNNDNNNDIIKNETSVIRGILPFPSLHELRSKSVKTDKIDAGKTKNYSEKNPFRFHNFFSSHKTQLQPLAQIPSLVPVPDPNNYSVDTVQTRNKKDLPEAMCEKRSDEKIGFEKEVEEEKNQSNIVSIQPISPNQNEGKGVMGQEVQEKDKKNSKGIKNLNDYKNTTDKNQIENNCFSSSSNSSDNSSDNSVNNSTDSSTNNSIQKIISSFTNAPIPSLPNDPPSRVLARTRPERSNTVDRSTTFSLFTTRNNNVSNFLTQNFVTVPTLGSDPGSHSRSGHGSGSGLDSRSGPGSGLDSRSGPGSGLDSRSGPGSGLDSRSGPGSGSIANQGSESENYKVSDTRTSSSTSSSILNISNTNINSNINDIIDIDNDNNANIASLSSSSTTSLSSSSSLSINVISTVMSPTRRIPSINDFGYRRNDFNMFGNDLED